jgi:hypothetical protein
MTVPDRTGPLATYCARCGAVTGRICVVCADEELFMQTRTVAAHVHHELRLLVFALVFVLAAILAASTFYTSFGARVP